MSDPSPGHSILVNESLRQRFEASWVAGTPEPLSECLPGTDTDEFLPTLEELIHIQLEFAWKARAADGERPVAVQALLGEFPVLGDDDVLLGLLRQEYHCREQAGDAPSVDDYRESYPDLDPDQLTTPPGETVVPKASDDTATRATPGDQRTLPLPGASSPAPVTDDVTLNSPPVDDQTLASSPGSPGPDSLYDDATIAGEGAPAVSIVDENSTDTINTETSGSQVVFEPGKQVPGYELLGELGRGGMGVVYRALDTRLKRVVALKMILSGAHAGEQDLKRFQREAEAVAQLQHPNIVQIHDVGEHDGQPFLSLEFVEGGGLDEKIGGEPQPPDEAAALVEQLAHAVHFAHERNIVHRDLKPANVLLTAEGEPKITDFGLAKRLEEDASQTASGSIMGTPSYMAPEQAGDKKGTIGPPTDVYALGAILYCLLTGRPPFQSSSLMDTVMQVLEQDPVPPSHLVTGLDKNLETITLKCLQKAPEKRYQAALELGDELDRFRKGEPIKARPVGTAERTWKWIRRNPLGATVAVLILAMGIGGPLLAIQQAAMARKLLNQSYISDMALTRVAWDEANIRQVRGLLARSNASPHLRGFEWRYWRRIASTADATVEFSSGIDNRIGWIDFVDQGEGLLISEYNGNTIPLVELADLRGENRHDKSRSLRTFGGIASGIPLAYSPVLKEMLFKDDVLSEGAITRYSLGSLDEFRAFEAQIRVDGAEKVSTKSPRPKSLEKLTRHKGVVRCATFTRDGRFACSGGDDHLVKLWRTADSGRVTTLEGHRGRVNCVAFDPEGNRLASGGADLSVRIWNTSDGKYLAEFNEHKGWVRAVCFSHDGKRVFSAGSDGNLFIWEPESGRVVFTLIPDGTSIRSLALSPDGSRIATGTFGGIVTMWDTTSGKRIIDLRGHSDSITCLRFDPNGRWLASGSDDGLVKLWYANLTSLNKILPRAKGPIYGVSFSPDGSQIASCGLDGVVRIADVSSGEPTLNLPIARGRLSELVFTPDGKSVVVSQQGGLFHARESKSGNAVGSVRIGTGRPLNSPRGHFSLTVDGTRAVVALAEKAIICDTTTGKELFRVNRRLNRLCDVEFSRTGETVATTTGRVSLFNGKTGEFIRDCEHSRRMGPLWLTVALSADGHIVAAGSEDGRIGVWDAKSGHRLLALKRHRGSIVDVKISPQGDRIASCGRDGTVRLLETETGHEVLLLKAHDGPVNVVAFSPDGNLLASGGNDGYVKIWDAMPWTAKQQALYVAHHVADFHSRSAKAKSDLVESISKDPLISEPVRMAALEVGTRRWEARVDFTARTALQNELGTKGQLLADAVATLQASVGLSADVRKRVGEVAGSTLEDPQALNNASWIVVKKRDSTANSLELALRQAERAVELAPGTGAYLNTLGVARYRLANYAKSLEILTTSLKLNVDRRTGNYEISDLVFIAMCHHQLGDKRTAKKAFENARFHFRKRRVEPDSEESIFIKEMEALFASPVNSGDG